MTTLLERFQTPGPKRILALDGGGIRGALTLGFLERIERVLRDRHDDDSLVLADYFDLIGGTSTGAIIASALAIGMDAAEIKAAYLDLGGKIFGQRRSWWPLWRIRSRLESKFDKEPLEKALKEIHRERRLGSPYPDVRTGLCIVTKRADTQSTWPLINHPGGRYFDVNEDIPLWQAVRASTAAPTFFVPEKVDVGNQFAAFVDGGVSVANNPALLLMLVATLEGFPFGWRTGADQLLVVSVGTGHWSRKRPTADVLDAKLWDWATQIPGMLIEDASWQNQIVLQWLSRSPTAQVIDREIGDLANDVVTGEPALSYLRYDVELSSDALRSMGLPELAGRAEDLRAMEAAENREDLAEVGRRAAKAQVEAKHFPHAFDLPARGA